MVPLCLGNRVSFVLRSVRCVVRSAGCVVRSRILATCYSLLATCLVSMCLLAGVAWAEYTGGSYDGYSSDTSSDADIGGQAVLISSRANQAFMVAPAASQEISPILITDVEGAGITAEDATGASSRQQAITRTIRIRMNRYAITMHLSRVHIIVPIQLLLDGDNFRLIIVEAKLVA